LDFSIRQAELKDIPWMCGLLKELFSIEADFSPDREKQAAGLSLLVGGTNGSSIALIAEADSEIIGMCTLQVLISTSEGGIVGLLEDLIVKKGYRSKGAGRQLIEEIIKWSKTRNIRRIQLLRDINNTEAHDFYLSQGWKDTKLVCMRLLT
jgi:GNAT superfamily N-acetyltransferase